MAATKTITNAEALRRLATALDKLDKSLDTIGASIAPPAPSTDPTVGRSRFGYAVLSGLMGRRGAGVPAVGATRTRDPSGSSITFTSLPKGGRKAELRSGNKPPEIVDIRDGKIKTPIPADHPIESVLILGSKGQVIGIGPSLRAL